MALPLESHLITLTGAASGIGLSTALHLARLGASLSISDINPTTLATAHTTLVSLSTSPSKIYSTVLDIRSTTAVNTWINTTISHFGRPITGCANIAGFHPIWTPKNIEEMTDEEFDEVMGINTTGVFKCLRAQLQPGVLDLEHPGGPSIVNVGSVSGLIGFAGDAAYVASKHAVHGLTKSVSKEVGKRGIRVNTVAPGQTDTPMVRRMVEEGKGLIDGPGTSLGRGGKAEEVAEVIVWLLGERSGYVTGSTYRVDGGMLE